MAMGDVVAPTPDMGAMAGKKQLPQDDSVTCPCCGQGTTKQQLRQYVDSLPSAQPSPDIASPGVGMDTPPPMDETAMAKQYA